MGCLNQLREFFKTESTNMKLWQGNVFYTCVSFCSRGRVSVQGVSVQGGLCPGLSLSRWSLSGKSLSREGSLSRGVSVHGGSMSMGVSFHGVSMSREVSVWGDLCPG